MKRSLDTLEHDLQGKIYRLSNEILNLEKTPFPAGFVYEPNTVEMSQLFSEVRGNNSISKEQFVAYLIKEKMKLQEILVLIQNYKNDPTFMAPHVLCAKPKLVRKDSFERIGSPTQYIGHIVKDTGYVSNSIVLEYHPEERLVYLKHTYRGKVRDEDGGFLLSEDDFATSVLSHMLRIVDPHFKKQQIPLKDLTVLAVDVDDVEYILNVVSETTSYTVGVNKEKVLFQDEDR
ncbi:MULTISPECIES: hypothetical protein [unclassified Paenibacillus]|uniref:hypothetical protein n=1 Tax=unclassified Paenibacillus TaxID=185978 RepID=UPI0027839127|nr:MULTISPECIES: hypothetical protein [unclassified Paenibacillus]MDQ0896285.1 hypothetical protein [Paenibacillus sp. V4I7]MDQ0913787.1 hypothetical protein [Paenibacillus sp. V4I5]